MLRLLLRVSSTCIIDFTDGLVSEDVVQDKGEGSVASRNSVLALTEGSIAIDGGPAVGAVEDREHTNNMD